jgi:hypothetical protein
MTKGSSDVQNFMLRASHEYGAPRTSPAFVVVTDRDGGSGRSLNITF